MCLKGALRKDLPDMNYVALCGELMPVIMDLLGKFGKAHIIWPLIELLTVVFTKSRFTAQNLSVADPVQSDTFKNILKLDDELLIGALSEMFKTMIASFPPGTVLSSIYYAALELINNHLGVRKS